MYFSKYGAYSVESGLFIFFASFLCEVMLVRTPRLRNLYASLKRRFHIGIEREALREIGVGLGRTPHPQPEHPAIGVDLSVAWVEGERPVVIGEGGVEIALRIARVRAIVVALRPPQVQFDGASV